MKKFVVKNKEDYQRYLLSTHWINLRKRLITNNKKAKCWISGRKDHLVLHHESYKNLGKEKLGKDVFYIHDTYHTKIHFINFLFWKKRISMETRQLRKRRYYLKSCFCFSRWNIFAGLFWLLASLIK